MQAIKKATSKVTGKLTEGVKGIGHIVALEDKLKAFAKVSIESLILNAKQVVEITPQFQRGEKAPVELRKIKLNPTGAMKKFDFPSNGKVATSIDTTIYISKNMPKDKVCTLQFFQQDDDNEKVLVAEKKINLALHFGENFAVQTYDLDRVQSSLGDKLHIQSAQIKIEFALQEEDEKST